MHSQLHGKIIVKPLLVLLQYRIQPGRCRLQKAFPYNDNGDILHDPLHTARIAQFIHQKRCHQNAKERLQNAD